MNDQTDVREFLRSMADETGFVSVEPGPVVQKARRRRARNVGATLLTAGALVAGAVVGANGLMNGDRLSQHVPPVDQPAPAGALVYALGGDIYVADPNGANAVVIADGPDAGCAGNNVEPDYEEPAWSPDGRYVAFWQPRCSLSGFNLADVLITDPGGNVVAEVPAEGWGFSWSPDSTRVALWGTYGETIEVYGVGGERQTSLRVPPKMYEDMPAAHTDSGPGVWMPDGSALLYGSFVWPLDGSAPHELSLGGHDLDGEVSYSPDGTRIAVATDNSIAVINVDGSPVSDVDAPPTSGVGAWSPDGERLATLSEKGLLGVADVASGTVTPLPEADAAIPIGWQIVDARAFSPQGDRILYTAIDGAGLAALWSIGVDGSNARLIVSGTTEGEWLSEGRDQSWH